MKRIITFALICAMTATTFVGCGNGATSRKAGGKGTLKVTVAKLGYGDKWILDMAEAYKEKTGISIEVVSKVGEAGLSAISTEMDSRKSDTDIFFTKSDEYHKTVYSGAVAIEGKTYDCEFADLTDVWMSKANDKDEKTIQERMNQSFEDYYNVDGKYYALPWASTIMGIVRNKNVWDKLSLKDADVPRTTDEMFALCDKVKAKGTAPFIYSLESEYYTSFLPIWFVQYEGSTNMENFYNGLDPLGEKTHNLYTYDGQERALEVLQKLVLDENGYQHETSLSASFTDMQSVFLVDQALFCVNGSWLETEMGENYAGANIDYIKTPVISSIIERLDSVNDDATLSAVIKYVDGEAENAPAGVTEEDIEIIREARGYAYEIGGMSHVALVPAYSDKIDMAKEFLKFMYSDEGMNVYYNSTMGAQLPAECGAGYDDSIKISGFRACINQIMEEQQSSSYERTLKTKIFSIGGVNRFWMNGLGSPVRSLRDGDSPGKICADNNEYLQKHWSNMTNY